MISESRTAITYNPISILVAIPPSMSWSKRKVVKEVTTPAWYLRPKASVSLNVWKLGCHPGFNTSNTLSTAVKVLASCASTMVKAAFATVRWPVSQRTLILVASSSLIFLICAGSAFGFWFLADPNYRAAWYGWRESMRVESARHPVSIRIVWPWLAFFLATAPLVPITIPFAMVSEWRKHRLSIILLIAAMGLFANLLLLANYSTAVIWRYFLTGLPALVPLSSNYLIEWFTRRLGTKRRAFMASAVVIGLIAVAFGIYSWRLRSEIVTVRAASKEYDKALKQLPRDAVMISGAQSVAVKYWRGVGEGDWDVIAPGAGWPGPQLPSVIEGYLKQGRRVFIDADPRWWQPCGWHVPEIEELTRLQSQFNFRRAARTLYEIRPRTDSSVTDQPHLQSLLPENRPEEVKICFNSG